MFNKIVIISIILSICAAIDKFPFFGKLIIYPSTVIVLLIGTFAENKTKQHNALLLILLATFLFPIADKIFQEESNEPILFGIFFIIAIIVVNYLLELSKKSKKNSILYKIEEENRYNDFVDTKSENELLQLLKEENDSLLKSEEKKSLDSAKKELDNDRSDYIIILFVSIIFICISIYTVLNAKNKIEDGLLPAIYTLVPVSIFIYWTYTSYSDSNKHFFRIKKEISERVNRRIILKIQERQTDH